MACVLLSPPVCGRSASCVPIIHHRAQLFLLVFFRRVYLLVSWDIYLSTSLLWASKPQELRAWAWPKLPTQETPPEAEHRAEEPEVGVDTVSHCY